MLLGLKTGEFAYQHFVTSYDPENLCGTVCCIMGWYPKYFPESGLDWEINDNKTDLSMSWKNGDPDDVLAKYHGVSDDVIQAIFYCDVLPDVGGNHMEQIDLKDAVLADAIERVEKLIELIETGKIDNHLRLDEKEHEQVE